MAEQFCTRCGAPVVPNSRFCTRCGAPAQAPVVEPNPVNTADPQGPACEVEQEIPPQYTAQQAASFGQAAPQGVNGDPTGAAPTSSYPGGAAPLPNHFCRQCGQALLPNAVVCTRCGVPVGSGAGFCPACGRAIHPQAVVCVHCGVPVSAAKTTGGKSKLAAGLLGIFLGSLGVHNFYLGYNGRAIAQLLMSTIGWVLVLPPIAAAIWGLVEGIMILTGGMKTDASGQPLSD